MSFIDTGIKLDEVPLGENRLLTIADAQVALFHTADGLFALDNICPHRGAPLYEGFVTDGKVTCPWHQWDFQLADGVCANIPRVRTSSYAVEVRDGTVWINLEDQGAKKAA